MELSTGTLTTSGRSTPRCPLLNSSAAATLTNGLAPPTEIRISRDASGMAAGNVILMRGPSCFDIERRQGLRILLFILTSAFNSFARSSPQAGLLLSDQTPVDVGS